MSTIHERILEIIEQEGISITKFEQSIDVGVNVISTALRRKSAISHVFIKNIVTKYPKYSLSWLVLGENETPKEQAFNRVLKAIEGVSG